MREFKINRQYALDALARFLEGVQAYEASEEFMRVVAKNDEFLSQRRAAIENEERLAVELLRLEKAAANANFFQRGNAAMELAMFKAAHPYLTSVISPTGHYIPPDGWPWDPRDHLRSARDAAVRERDFLLVLEGDSVLLEEYRVEQLAAYASGRRLQSVKDRLEGRA